MTLVHEPVARAGARTLPHAEAQDPVAESASIQASDRLAAARMPTARGRVTRVLNTPFQHGVGGNTEPAQLSFDFTRW